MTEIDAVNAMVVSWPEGDGTWSIVLKLSGVPDKDKAEVLVNYLKKGLDAIDHRPHGRVM